MYETVVLVELGEFKFEDCRNDISTLVGQSARKYLDGDWGPKPVEMQVVDHLHTSSSHKSSEASLFSFISVRAAFLLKIKNITEPRFRCTTTTCKDHKLANWADNYLPW